MYNKEMTTQILDTTLSKELTLEEKLKAIEEAMKAADGDAEKQTKYVEALIDPMDSLHCEGCQ